MLKRFEVAGFKAFGGHEAISVAPITLIFGPNSAGKSSLIQSLMLVKQSVEGGNADGADLVVRGPIVDLGSFPALMNNHDLTGEVEVAITFELRGDAFSSPGQRLPGPRTFGLRGGWDETARSARLIRTLLGIGDHSFAFDRASTEDVSPEIPGLRMWRDGFVLRDAWSQHQLVRLLTALTQLPPFGDESSSLRELAAGVLGGLGETFAKADVSLWFDGRGLLPSRLHSLATESRAGSVVPARGGLAGWATDAMGEQAAPLAAWIESSVNEVLRTIASELDEALARMHYLGPMRRAPERFEVLSGIRREHVGTQGEHYVELLAQHEALRSEVNRWMERLGTGYSIQAERLAASDAAGVLGDVVGLTLRDRRSGVKLSPRDVGFGISQLAPIVVQSLLAKFSTLCVEQPELHLHPRLQAELGDLFISASEVRGNQFLVETHSEHLILRLLRRVREGRIDKDWIRVLYVEPDEARTASVHELEIDDSGTFLDEWPSGFFEERLREVLG